MIDNIYFIVQNSGYNFVVISSLILEYNQIKTEEIQPLYDKTTKQIIINENLSIAIDEEHFDLIDTFVDSNFQLAVINGENEITHNFYVETLVKS